MKKVTLILGLLAISGFVVAGCAKKQEIKPTETPVASQPTETTVAQPAVTAEQTAPVEKSLDEIQQELTMIHFDFAKSAIRPDAKTVLESNAKVLNDNPNVKVQIAGYCDERGSVEYNLALGEKRANAAKDYLVTLGIAPDRLSTISYGKSDPIDPAHNEKAWSMNRRAEFHVVK